MNHKLFIPIVIALVILVVMYILYSYASGRRDQPVITPSPTLVPIPTTLKTPFKGIVPTVPLPSTGAGEDGL